MYYIYIKSIIIFNLFILKVNNHISISTKCTNKKTKKKKKKKRNINKYYFYYMKLN